VKYGGGTQNGIAYRFTIAYDDKGIPDLQKTKVERFGAEAGIKNALGIVYNIKGINYFVADSALYTFDNKLKRFGRDTTFGPFPTGDCRQNLTSWKTTGEECGSGPGN
jgi:hypothetical protein